MRWFAAFLFVLMTASEASGGEYVFENRLTRLALGSDGTAISLIDRVTGKNAFSRKDFPFAAIRKGGRLFPASAVVRHRDLFHVTFGTSGVDAEYRITAHPEYTMLELADFHGDGIEEIRLMQLPVSLGAAGPVMGVRWNKEFAVCLMGLSPRVYSRIEGPAEVASVYPAFPMLGERVLLLAAPTLHFLDTVRKAEQDFHLPSPTINRVWAKRSEDVRSSYLFTDLTEANADATIRYAKLGGFRYILVYSATWAVSPGTYDINTTNYPRGEASLKGVIDKCHAAGIKVGMHMLTSFVGKNDPLVRPKPNPGLLKDAEGTLAADASETAIDLRASSPLRGYPAEGFPYGPANEVQIDDEIIRYGQISGATFSRCERGFAGTRPAKHRAGAKIHHLVEYGGSYIADLRTPLKDAISDRVAGLINRCGFDMIYFDGGEINDMSDPGWYWLGQQQAQIVGMVKRDILVQGSGISNWTWHIFARGTSDDTSAVAVKEYLDYHKIADYWAGHRNDFLPAELGWAGIFQYAPDHPATTPDEIEYYAVRMLALDSAVSFETDLRSLKANGRTEEMLTLLGRYERLRLGHTVSAAVRKRLETGEWHMTEPGVFHPIRYDATQLHLPGEVSVSNEFGEQPLKFRFQLGPELAVPGDRANIPLVRSDAAAEVRPPDGDAVLPGWLAERFDFTNPQGAQNPAFLVGPRANSNVTGHGGPLDLGQHRALAIELDVEGPENISGDIPVLNIQLETAGKTFRDYYLDLDFRGDRTIVLPEPGTRRMLAEFRPAAVNYPFKAATMGGFDYGSIAALNVRWMRYRKGSGVRCRLKSMEALQERDVRVSKMEISAGSSSIPISVPMRSGDYAEYWGEDSIRVFDRDGKLLSTLPAGTGPKLKRGENKLVVRSPEAGDAVLTVITTGK